VSHPHCLGPALSDRDRLESLQAARRSAHMLDGEIELTGEQNMFGIPQHGRVSSQNS
jgi:hypothetical protein